MIVRRKTKIEDASLHLAQLNNLLLLCHWVDFHDAEGSAHAQGTVNDVDTKDNRVSLGKGRNDLESTGPNSLRSSISALRLHDLIVIRREGIEQMVNDISWTMVSYIVSML